MSIGNKKAFAGPEVVGLPGGGSETTHHGGMTYREWLVGMIASGIHAHPMFVDCDHIELAYACTDLADAIIADLDLDAAPKSKPPKSRTAPKAKPSTGAES